MTLFTDVIASFYHYIEEDVDFFNYFDLDEDECMEVAGQRAEVLLTEAASYISRKMVVENVFSKTEVVQPSNGFSAEERAFTETLNNMEINLLVHAMFLMYLYRDVTKLRTFHGVLSSSDLNMYSPANERKTFMAMVQQYEDNLKVEISEYQMYDRQSGSFAQICD